MSGTEWTDDDLRTLVEMKGAGKSNPQIAKALGRSLMSVKACLNRCIVASDALEVGG